MRRANLLSFYHQIIQCLVCKVNMHLVEIDLLCRVRIHLCDMGRVQILYPPYVNIRHIQEITFRLIGFRGLLLFWGIGILVV